MRHVVYLLLVANLVYLGWNILQTSSVDGVVRTFPPLPATATRLVTLQEMQEETEEEEKKQDTVVEMSAIEALEEGDEKQDAVVGVSVIEELTQQQPPGAGVALSCQTLGPFLAAEKMQLVEKKLAELGLEVTQRTNEVREQIGYWVYLPAMEREKVLQITKHLDENNDEDYFIGKDNVLSLGAFKGLQRANVRLESTRKLGLDPLLEPRYSTMSAQWFDLQVTPAGLDALAEIAEQDPDLNIEILACP
jgi:hypothetical protein